MFVYVNSKKKCTFFNVHVGTSNAEAEDPEIQQGL